MRFVLALSLLGVLACGGADGLLAPSATAPDVTLRDLDGHAFQLSSLRGKTVLINFWFRH